MHDQLRGELSAALAELHGQDALASAALQAVVIDLRALAVAVFRNGQHVRALFIDRQADDLVALGQVHRLDAHAHAAHGADVALAKADGHAALGRQQDLLLAVGQLHAHQLVVLAQHDGDQAGAAQVLELRQRRLLDQAQARGHDEIALLRARGDADHCGDLLAALQLQQVDDRRAARRAPGLRDLVAPDLVDPAAVGEEHEVLMRGHDQQLLGVVLVARAHARHALAAAVLAAVGARGQALDVAEVRQRHDHVLFLDQVLRVDLLGDGGDLRAPLVGVLAPHLEQLSAHDRQQQLLVGQDRAKARDGLLQLGVLLLQPLALQAGQAGQAHVQNGLRLLLGEVEARHQRVARDVRALALADGAHDLVDVVQRLEQALQDVRARLGLVQVVAGAAGGDLLLVLQVVVEHLVQREHLRLAVDQGQHDRAEGFLQLRVLVQVVEHDGGVDILLELDDDAHAAAVGLVADVGDALDAPLVHELGDLLDQARLVDHVGDLGDDDARARGAHLLDLGARAGDDAPAAGGVGLIDALAAHDDAAGGEVRALDVLHQVLERGLRVVDQADDAVDHLAQVVRRDVRGHAHGDAAGAVDQQVGVAAGHDRRLHERLVEVGHKVDGLLVQVGDHLLGDLGHARLGVAHGRGAVAVDGAEVALALHEHVARGEVLRQAHHRVVHSAVAVRVVLAQHVAHDARALAVGLVGRHAQLVHGVDDAPVHGLEAVAHVRQRAGDDDRHGVGDERLLHLRLQVDGDQALRELRPGLLLGRAGGLVILLVQSDSPRCCRRGAPPLRCPDRRRACSSPR